MRWRLATFLGLALAACTGESMRDAGPDASLADVGPTDAGFAALDPQWSTYGSPPTPTGLHSAVLVEVTGQRRLVLHGGSKFPDGDSGDTWSFSLDDETWTRLETRNAPAPRYDHCGAYLASTNELLVVNGANQRGPLAREARVLDLDELVWTPVVGPPPGASGCQAVWDPVAERVVIFGGEDDLTLTNHTWAYDPQSRTFSDLAPAVVPSPRRDAMMVWDPATKRVLLFGGRDGLRSYASDTWAFEGNEWRELATDAIHPPQRRAAAHAIDETGQWFVFGGETELESLDDLWRFDATTEVWVAANRPDPPSKRSNAAFSRLTEDGALVLFGGYRVEDFRSLDDGYRLDFR